MLNNIIIHLNEIHTSRTTKEKVVLAVTLSLALSLSLSGTVAKIMGRGIACICILINKLFMLLT